MKSAVLGVHAFDGIEAYAVQANVGSVPVLGIAFHHDDGVDVMFGQDERSVPHVVAGSGPFCASRCAGPEFLDREGMDRKPSEMVELLEEIRHWVLQGKFQSPDLIELDSEIP